jgi:hypothetical protein
LDDLLGCVAADLNRTTEPRKQKALERIYDKINRLLRTYADPCGLPALSEAVELNEWAATMISMAERRGIPTSQRSCKVVLSKAQRRTILELKSVSDDIKELMAEDAAGNRTFDLTADELVLICRALAEPLSEAQGKYRTQLLKAAEKIAQGLNEGLTSRKRPRRTSTKSKTAFQLRITLQDVQPAVWRVFQVLDCALLDLHETIQAVMGWENRHLYKYQVGDVRYFDPAACENSEVHDARQMKLSHVVSQGYERFAYVYDFGDHWQHVVEIESTFQPEDGVTFPVCLEGSGNCPPEDVGGAMGYARFLKVINEPQEEEYRHYLDWCGGWFDPDAFDLELVHRSLGQA